MVTQNNEKLSQNIDIVAWDNYLASQDNKKLYENYDFVSPASENPWNNGFGPLLPYNKKHDQYLH